jgi:ABC-2 type transport system permease protein
MTKGYWLVSADIIDPSGVELYLTESDRAFRKFGGQLLVRGGSPETVEGAGRSQFLVVEFKDYISARECYHSPDYNTARNAAKDKIVFDVVITEGHSPQPTGNENVNPQPIGTTEDFSPQPAGTKDQGSSGSYCPERDTDTEAATETGSCKADAAKLRGLDPDVGKEADFRASLANEHTHVEATEKSTKTNDLPRGIVRTATKDLGLALKAWRIWVLLGTNDIRQRYRRSKLGQFWITATIAATVVGLGIVYSAIFKQSIEEYLPYVAAGFVVWFLITGMITEGCTAFLDSEGYAKQLTVPLSVYVLRTWFRILITFAHNAIIIPFVWLIFLVPVGWACWLVIPGICLIALNGLWIMLLLGTLCARFRDLPQIISSFVQVVFFVTPVMFRSDQLPTSGRAAMDLNPFAALLAVAREPLVGRVPSALEYLSVIGILLFGWAIAVSVYGRYRTRIIYWL